MPDPVQPGWQPDPQHAGMLRWWNGLGWSDARKAVDAAGGRGSAVRPVAEDDLRRGVGRLADARSAAAGEAARLAEGVAPAGGARAPVARAVRSAATANSLAVSALVLGVLGVVLGAYGLLPLAALVVSVRALVRSRRLAQEGARSTGLGQSLAGLVLSVVGLLRWLPVLADLLGRIDLR